MKGENEGLKNHTVVSRKICKMCEKEKNLVNSHIIPKSFYKEVSPDNDLKIIDNKGSFPKKSPTGVYDQFICQNCENLFNDGDDYIKKIFGRELNRPSAKV